MPMRNQALATSVKEARQRLNLTQAEAANLANVDSRTLLNIEGGKGNPTFEVLHSLIRTLNIDSQEIFYPELLRKTPWLQELRILVESCNESEAEALLHTLQAVLKVLRSKDSEKIE